MQWKCNDGKQCRTNIRYRFSNLPKIAFVNRVKLSDQSNLKTIVGIKQWLKPHFWNMHWKRNNCVIRFVYLQHCLSVILSIRPSVRLSVRPSVRPSVCLSVCLSVRLSVCLSVCLSVSRPPIILYIKPS